MHRKACSAFLSIQTLYSSLFPLVIFTTPPSLFFQCVHLSKTFSAAPLWYKVQELSNADGTLRLLRRAKKVPNELSGIMLV